MTWLESWWQEHVENFGNESVKDAVAGLRAKMSVAKVRVLLTESGLRGLW